MTDYPKAYLITFTTYGTWLHGNEAGSVWENNSGNTKLIDARPKLETSQREILKNEPFVMNTQNRQIVLEAILEVCHYRKWQAYAVHVRTNHVHIVISGRATPEKIMNDCKIYATRALKTEQDRKIPPKIWTRHGSTRYLWDAHELSNAVRYVREQQGEIMAYGQTVINPQIPSPDREGGDEKTMELNK